MFSIPRIGLFLGALSLTLAAPRAATFEKRTEDGIEYNVAHSPAHDASMKFVKNSGLCETTPGVNQYSGYIDVGPDMHMWFWFFEARNSPQTAPFVTWLNGGPGCSSMIGLFQENGPCHFVNGSSEPSLSPYSFNEYANMIYVDQPIGTGFSYGDDTVDSTLTAAPYVWTLLQMFFEHFPQYECRDYRLFTESYGGHYGPEFAAYFEEKNAAIAHHQSRGEPIHLKALGINNGWYDPIIQYKAYITYGAHNKYNIFVNASEEKSFTHIYNMQCLPGLQECNSLSGEDHICSYADNQCYNLVQGPINDLANFDAYDVREPADDPYPPEIYTEYLYRPDIQQRIGAKTNYSECPDAPYNLFNTTGDDARSFIPKLAEVIASGVNFVAYAGDADWECNYIGVLQSIESTKWAGQNAFANQKLKPYTVNGVQKGLFKSVRNVNYLQVFNAGHEVPYYQPQTALQLFKQVMKGGPLTST